MRADKYLDPARKAAVLKDPAAWTLLLTVAFVAVVAAWFAHLYHFNVVDDAYISFQYAKNWAMGRGLVFNPGERVEGYTNFLWIVVLAPVYALTRATHWDFTRTAIWLNIGIAMVDLVLVYVVARRLFQRSWVATSVPLVLLALDNAYLGYAMSALENHLLIGCLLGAVAVWQSRPKRAWAWTGLLLSLAAMTRPDATLAVAAFGLSGLVSIAVPDKVFAPEPRRVAAARVFAALGVCAVLYGAYFLWRMNYYGALLPNTFYLKVGSTLDAVDRGLGYALSFLQARYYLPVVALLALPGIRHPIVRWMVTYCLLHFAYVIYVGGDFYSGHRFYVVLLPQLYLLVGWVVYRIQRRIGATRAAARLFRRGAVVAVMIGLGSGAATWFLCLFTLRGFETGPYTNEIVMWGEFVDNNIRYMRWLRTFVAPGSSMVLGDIGGAGFLADVRAIDVYGVIDPSIARKKIKGFGRGKAGHEKVAQRDYLLSRDPTYVKWGYVPGDLQPHGYYIFTEFPPGFRIDGLWVREDLGDGYYLPDTAMHFIEPELRGWERWGNAFAEAPTERPVRGQLGVFGHVGSYLDSFTAGEGDRAVGRMLSPPFPLVGDLMLLRVGGGRDREGLRVSLLVDDDRVFSATGHDYEVLGRRVWRIEPYKGRFAQLEIVDEAKGRWGHILVDEVVQWVNRRQ